MYIILVDKTYLLVSYLRHLSLALISDYASRNDEECGEIN